MPPGGIANVCDERRLRELHLRQPHSGEPALPGLPMALVATILEEQAFPVIGVASEGRAALGLRPGRGTRQYENQQKSLHDG
jgi:hypothetical protein